MKNYIEQLFSLNNKVAIVTNASQGFGAILVKGLAQSGAMVCGTGTHTVAKLQPSKNESYIRCNVQDAIAFKCLCEDLYDKYKKINVLVNVTEIDTSSKAIETEAKAPVSFQAAIEYKLDTVIGNSKTIASCMKKSGGGSIINVINLKNAVGFPDDFSYIATKNALLMMTKKLAVDLIKDNIRINNIILGYFQNEISPMPSLQLADTIDFERAINHQWKDLVGSTVFLASNNSSSMTGQDIFIIGDRSNSGKHHRILSSIS